MSRTIELLWIGDGPPPDWPLGNVVAVRPTPVAVEAATRERLAGTRAEAWLFWGSRLGPPDPARVCAALERPGDVWHAGLRLGMGGLPRAIDFVAPTWMLNRDPDPSIEATSWRLSLEACLVRTDVLRALGGVRPEFETLAGAALELGHRWVRRGALMRHVPSLLHNVAADPPQIPFVDEMRFVRLRFGDFWLRWSLLRSLSTSWADPFSAFSALRLLSKESPAEQFPPYRGSRMHLARPTGGATASVTILIPTVDRYPYLEKLLEQFRTQTVPPLEIIIVDQTTPGRRRSDFAERFSDLPLRALYLDHAGQCSSRNAGIEASLGNHILFVDDDDEVPPDLIERHLGNLRRFGIDVSCGVAEEVGAGPLPMDFRLTRTSDVFPTNNSLIQKDVLKKTGLFDVAYDRGARADADLGMRLYLSGALMILDPEISVLHHHAPSGGLRTHKARVVTYASSRKRLTHRNIAGATELYLAMRYFSSRQVREMKLLQAFGTLAFSGSRIQKLLKAVVGLILLPNTMWRIRSRTRQASSLLASGPRIPRLGECVGQGSAVEVGR